MLDYLNKIAEGLSRYRDSNRQPAVEEPANDYEKAVNDWHELQQLQALIKDLTRTLNDAERKQRDALASGLSLWLAGQPEGVLKEGVNDYELSNGRKLKYDYGVDRKIEGELVQATREAYAAVATPTDPAYDSLFRIKYELEIRPYRKLSAKALKALGKLITAKPKAPTLEVK